MRLIGGRKMHPFWQSFIAFGVFLTVESVASLIFIFRGKRRYPELWRAAGSPTIWSDSSLIGAWATNRYLLKKEYRSLSSSACREFAEKMRAPMLIGYFGSVIAVVVTFACLFVFGRP